MNKREKAVLKMFLYWLFLAPKTKKEMKLIKDYVFVSEGKA